MTGLLHRLFACLLALSLVTGGAAAQVMHGQAAGAVAPTAASAPGAAMADCHSADADAGTQALATLGSGDCCATVRPGDGHDACGAACTCPLLAAAVPPALARAGQAVPRQVLAVAGTRGDPGRAPVPPRRPPIA